MTEPRDTQTELPRRTAWFAVVEFMIRRCGWLLAMAGLLTVLSIGPARRLTFDQSIESLYADGDPHLREYRQSKSWFGGDDFVFVAYSDPELMSEAGVQRNAELTRQIKDLPGVLSKGVESLSELLRMGRNPLLRRRHDALMEFGRGLVVSQDGQTAAIMAPLAAEGSAGTTHAQTVAELRRIAAAQPLPTCVVGEPVLVQDLFRYAQNDGARMGWAAAGLLAVVILVFLRDVRSVLLPLAIVQATILWTKALLAESHLPLTMVSSILDSLVTIIGVSTVVYTSLYYRSLRATLGREAALRQMLQVVGLEIVWVCVTSATGFSAQLTSHIHPVQSFGLTMAAGCLLVLMAIALILPGGLLLGPEAERLPQPRGQAQISRSLLAVTEFVLRRREVAWGLGAALLVFSLAGLQRLQIETDFSKNFRASTPVRQALNFLEQHLGGAGVWEVNFDAPAELNEAFLARVRTLADKLRGLQIAERPGLTKVIAVSDGLDLVPRVPLLIRDLDDRQKRLGQLQPQFLPSLYNADAGKMRIMLRAREQGSASEKQELIAAVTDAARAEFPDAKVTGLYVLLTYLVDSLLHDQWIDLLAAASGLFLVMSLAYRSFRLGFISLIPNVLPMLVLLGAMGWCGVRINIGVAMISSDAMGLTIHDSIFYISAYRRGRQAGLNFRQALEAVQMEVRRPLIYSNIALILGFLVLTTSHFIPLVYFGLLVSVAIAGGLAVNLLLLPLLLQWSDHGSRPAAVERPAGSFLR